MAWHDPGTLAAVQEAPENANGDGLSAKRDLMIEVAVVVILLWLPGFWGAIVQAIDPLPRSFGGRDSIGSVIRSVGQIGILLYLLWGAGENWARFGFRRVSARTIGWFGVALAGAAIVEVATYSTSMIASAHPARLAAVQPYGSGLGFGLYLVIAVPLSAAAQEVLMRSYLITRLIDVGGSKALALVSSSLMFGLWHIGRGLPITVSTTIVGMLYGVVLLRSRSVWTVIAAHTVFNVLVLLGVLSALIDWVVTHSGGLH